MKRQSSLIQKSNDLEEYKTELAVCIEQKITAYRNDTKKIDELTFQCISALAEVDNAKAELSSKSNFGTVCFARNFDATAKTKCDDFGFDLCSEYETEWFTNAGRPIWYLPREFSGPGQ